MAASELKLHAVDDELIDVAAASASMGRDSICAFRVQLRNGAHVQGYSEHSLVILNEHNAVPVECRVGRERLENLVLPGNITIVPQGVEFTGIFGAEAHMTVLSIPKERLAASAASSNLSIKSLGPRISGFDSLLQVSVQDFFKSLSAGHTDGKEELIADDLVELVANTYCAAGGLSVPRGQLPSFIIADINRYVSENVGRSITINDLADIAKQNRYNFPRLFRRTVGISPHQYVLRMRLRHARELILAGNSLAEAASATGFVDQSHMSSWMRRNYGLTPGMLSKVR